MLAGQVFERTRQSIRPGRGARAPSPFKINRFLLGHLAVRFSRALAVLSEPEIASRRAHIQFERHPEESGNLISHVELRNSLLENRFKFGFHRIFKGFLSLPERSAFLRSFSFPGAQKWDKTLAVKNVCCHFGHKLGRSFSSCKPLFLLLQLGLGAPNCTVFFS